MLDRTTDRLTQELVIEPGRAERHYWRDLWRYRELFQVLAWRDMSVRYKQTVIGAAWALIRPFLTMVVFTVIFGKLANLPSDGTAPYALMVFAGMLPWTFFSTALSDASNSLVSNANLISKVYFPRLIVPMAAVGGGICRFRNQLRDARGADDLVPVPAGLADPAVAGIRRASIAGRPWAWSLAHRAQRQVPRLPLRNSVLGAAWSLCFSGRIQLEHCPRAVAPAVFPQPHGRGDRRVSLVHSRRSKVSFICPALLLSIGVTAFFLWLGIRQFRKMEKSFADLI